MNAVRVWANIAACSSVNKVSAFHKQINENISVSSLQWFSVYVGGVRNLTFVRGLPG